MPAKKTAPKKSAKTHTSKPLTFKNTVLLSRQAIFVLVFAAIGVVALVSSMAAPSNPKLQKFKNNAEKGWVWDGLREAKSDNSQCKSKDKDKKKDLVEVVNPQTGAFMACTHGPDPAEEGVDVRDRTEPVQTGEDDATAEARGGGTTTTGTTTASPITCDGDGVSGNRIQAIYARASDQPDRYSQYLASIKGWAAGVNNVFIESGLQNGSARNLRWVHDANCYVTVANVVLSPTGDDSINTTMSELQSQGYNKADRKYLIWLDANVYCGVGTIRIDDQPGVNNSNNYGSSWARVDNGCWSDPAYAAHEVMHNLGGVQSTAPHRSYQSHCTDEEDLMCYDDTPYGYNLEPLVMTYPCPFTMQKLFDCNDDDYFHSGTVPADNYLATHWNTANNIFLFAGSGSTTTPTPPTGDTIAPTVTISSPADGARIGNTTNISASASDNISVTRYEIWIDGVRKATTSTYSWNSKKASRGTHTITAKAFDAAGNVGQKSINITK